jgi:putative membrane protein
LSVPWQPTLNALLNGTSACLVAAGWWLARRRRIRWHRRAMLGAFASSTLFLASYLVYHARVGSVRFTGGGLLRSFYLALLASHTLLAAAVLPLVLLTLGRALARRLAAHRRLARWTAPLWLWVSVSGVAVYWMLYRI